MDGEGAWADPAGGTHSDGDCFVGMVACCVVPAGDVGDMGVVSHHHPLHHSYRRGAPVDVPRPCVLSTCLVHSSW